MAGAEHLREGLIGDEPGNGEPALPITRQPAIFAIWSAALPTAPDAPETKMVSPPRGFGSNYGGDRWSHS